MESKELEDDDTERNERLNQWLVASEDRGTIYMKFHNCPPLTRPKFHKYPHSKCVMGDHILFINKLLTFLFLGNNHI